MEMASERKTPGKYGTGMQKPAQETKVGGVLQTLSTGRRNNTVNGDTFRTRGISERRERHVRGAVNGAERPFRNFLAFCFVHWRNK